MWFVGFWLHYVMIFNSFQSRNYNSCIEVVELLKNLFLTELISASPHIWKIREWHWQIVSKFFLDYTQREKVVIWSMQQFHYYLYSKNVIVILKEDPILMAVIQRWSAAAVKRVASKSIVSLFWGGTINDFSVLI